MKNYNLGDLVCLKNHPYFENHHSIKITSNANMTPPVMVVTEVLDRDEHDKSNGKKLEIQIKCMYYSHKDGKYIDKWFKVDEIKELKNYEKSLLEFKDLNDIDKFDLEYLKNEYINKIICLKSVDLELNKKKVFLDSTDGKRVNKENNHLDFLPPVMTIIDVVKNKEEVKYSSKSKDIKEKDCSKYLFKCKWYNPVSTTYSEDFFPTSIIGLVNLDEKTINKIIDIINDNEVFYFTHNLKTSIKLETSSATVKKSLIVLDNVIFNHYYYNIGYFDTFSSTYKFVDSKSFNGKINGMTESQVFGKKIPDYSQSNEKIKLSDFPKGEYFQIKYVDQLNRFTTRIIKCTDIKDYNDPNGDDKDEYKYVVANCMLRDGKIRHFNLSRIFEMRKIVDGEMLFE